MPSQEPSKNKRKLRAKRKLAIKDLPAAAKVPTREEVKAVKGGGKKLYVGN